MVHELVQPTPGSVESRQRSVPADYKRLLELIEASSICLPSMRRPVLVCAHSVMGQILVYVLAGPLLKQLWPELEMTPEQVDRIR